MKTITTKNSTRMFYKDWGFGRLACGLVLIALLLPHVALADTETATYSITFTATWSNQTHPHPDFPARARFSPLIGAVHEGVFQPGPASGWAVAIAKRQPDGTTRVFAWGDEFTLE